MTEQELDKATAGEQEILDAAEIVLGEAYADHLPHTHAMNWDVRQELKRAGFLFVGIDIGSAFHFFEL